MPRGLAGGHSDRCSRRRTVETRGLSASATDADDKEQALLRAPWRAGRR